jgi:hypothetical protein
MTPQDMLHAIADRFGSVERYNVRVTELLINPKDYATLLKSPDIEPGRPVWGAKVIQSTAIPEGVVSVGYELLPRSDDVSQEELLEACTGQLVRR